MHARTSFLEGWMGNSQPASVNDFMPPSKQGTFTPSRPSSIDEKREGMARMNLAISRQDSAWPRSVLCVRPKETEKFHRYFAQVSQA